MEGETLSPPELLRVFLQGGAVEASQDQVVVRVMPGIPERNIPKEMKIRP